jgi:acylphosphatase
VKIRLRVIFSGRVQGVFFRANAKEYADEQGVAGWVRNTEDGRVEALFEGEEETVMSVISRCQHEQPYARVGSIERIIEEYKGDLAGFKIRH